MCDAAAGLLCIVGHVLTVGGSRVSAAVTKLVVACMGVDWCDGGWDVVR